MERPAASLRWITFGVFFGISKLPDLGPWRRCGAISLKTAEIAAECKGTRASLNEFQGIHL
jgi:hypothetical protein